MPDKISSLDKVSEFYLNLGKKMSPYHRNRKGLELIGYFLDVIFEEPD
jgi:hypothetical protein